MDTKYAELVKTTSQLFGYERGAICGFDLLMGLTDTVKTIDKRYEAWMRYINECRQNLDHSDEQRDGAWVPAIYE